MVLTSECIKTIKRNTTKVIKCCGLKLDMSKAFDRIEWDYIIEIIRACGFCENWCKLIKSCISTTSFSILINGGKCGRMKPRGIRQGDPLSPYLFILASEGLSRLLKYVEAEGIIQGLKIAKKVSSITHLMYADEAILFCKALPCEIKIIRELLKIHEKALDNN